MDTDPRAFTAALRHSHHRLASLVGALSGGQLTADSYASEWTIAQVLSHLGSGAEIGQLLLDAALNTSGSVDRGKFPAIWATWNAKEPQEQAADCLLADDAHISRLERLSDADLTRMKLDFFGNELDASGVARMRLSEHAMHTWDVAVAVDPVAVIAPDAVPLLTGFLPRLASMAGKAAGEPFSARLRGCCPGVDLRLEVSDSVSLAPWDGGEAAGEIALPSEALLRLCYGRLDPAHTPPGQVTGEDGLLDRVRAVFPGF
jgi:uncharacterized protein (TIGR03083 family)